MMLLARFRRARSLRKSIRKNVSIGLNFSVGENSVLWAPTSLVVGNGVKLGSNVRIEADGSIGDGVLIANSAGIVGRTDHDMSEVGMPVTETRWVGNHPSELSSPVTVGSDVWIGYGATILSGVTIGDSSVVGAGSVVTKDIPANSIAVGNPAKVVGQRFGDIDFELHWTGLEKSGYKRLSGGAARPTTDEVGGSGNE